MTMQLTTQAHDKPTAVRPSPRDLQVHILPYLTRQTRLEILKAIMAEPHAVVRITLNPDWDSCDPYGLPTRYSLERVDSLPRQLAAVLLATGRIPPYEFDDRRVWRAALGCPKHACKSHKPAAHATPIGKRNP